MHVSWPWLDPLVHACVQKRRTNGNLGWPLRLRLCDDSSARRVQYLAFVAPSVHFPLVPRSTPIASDCRSLVSGSTDKTLRIWRDAACVSVLEGHKGTVSTLLALVDGSVVSGSWDGTARYWWWICIRTQLCSVNQYVVQYQLTKFIFIC